MVLFALAVGAQQEPTYTFRVNADLVQISVSARDRNGRLVRDLTRDDFTVTEDGRSQQLSAVDLEVVRAGTSTAAPDPPRSLPVLTSNTPIAPGAARGLRLVVLFFDFSSLDAADAARSLRAAAAYVDSIGSADRVAVVTFATQLEVQQDFTGDKGALHQALGLLRGMSRAAIGGNVDLPGYAEVAARQRMRSLRSIAAVVGRVPQKKAIVIFAGSGPDPELADITATVNSAVRAGVSFYGIDAAGLTAAPPLGDASHASSFGAAVLSGTAVAQASPAARNDLLFALARGTGGRAFFDSNDFARPFRELENDTREYYLLSYRSSNLRHDGRYRRISVRVRRRGLQLVHPAGYYAPNDPSSSTSAASQP